MEESRSRILIAWVEYAATCVELLAVLIIVAVILVASISYIAAISARQADITTYTDFHHRVGRALLHGLEFWLPPTSFGPSFSNQH